MALLQVLIFTTCLTYNKVNCDARYTSKSKAVELIGVEFGTSSSQHWESLIYCGFEMANLIRSMNQIAALTGSLNQSRDSEICQKNSAFLADLSEIPASIKNIVDSALKVLRNVEKGMKSLQHRAINIGSYLSVFNTFIHRGDLKMAYKFMMGHLVAPDQRFKYGDKGILNKYMRMLIEKKSAAIEWIQKKIVFIESYVDSKYSGADNDSEETLALEGNTMIGYQMNNSIVDQISENCTGIQIGHTVIKLFSDVTHNVETLQVHVAELNQSIHNQYSVFDRHFTNSIFNLYKRFKQPGNPAIKKYHPVDEQIFCRLYSDAWFFLHVLWQSFTGILSGNMTSPSEQGAGPESWITSHAMQMEQAMEKADHICNARKKLLVSEILSDQS